MSEPYTPEELAAGARAVALEVYAPDSTDEEIASVVLSTVAPLIAARVRAEVAEMLDRLAEHHSTEARLALHSAAAHVLARSHRAKPETTDGDS